ncbi:MAG: hypothetical protein ACI906_001193, partial [Candidatus Latescibacterota bacterium]
RALYGACFCFYSGFIFLQFTLSYVKIVKE